MIGGPARPPAASRLLVQAGQRCAGGQPVSAGALPPEVLVAEDQPCRLGEGRDPGTLTGSAGSGLLPCRPAVAEAVWLSAAGLLSLAPAALDRHSHGQLGWHEGGRLLLLGKHARQPEGDLVLRQVGGFHRESWKAVSEN